MTLATGTDGTQHAVWNVVNPAATVSPSTTPVFRRARSSGRSRWCWKRAIRAGWGSCIRPSSAAGGALRRLRPHTQSGGAPPDDGGTTWSDATIPFPQHVGVNGTLAFAVDGNDDLHLLFGQRITGSPDIHGMWHSRLVGTQWSAPVPVVSGPRVVDLKGDTGFDPFDAHAVVSQGNVLLATWRTDPGDIMPNGVWYSFLRLDALPVVRGAAAHGHRAAGPHACAAGGDHGGDYGFGGGAAAGACAGDERAPARQTRQSPTATTVIRRPLCGAGAGGALALRRVGRGLRGGTKRRERGMSRSPAFPAGLLKRADVPRSPASSQKPDF
ncbi:MAG: hypothetical protein R2838_23570 [Caldilineaceae bacterium]